MSAFADQHFAEWSSVGARLWREEEAFVGPFLERLPLDAPILEIGTGSGRILLALAARGHTRLSGIDICPRLIAAAQESAAKCPRPPAFTVANAAELPFETASQRVVLGMQQVFSNIGKSAACEAALREIARVLEPGGTFLASFLSWRGRWYNPLLSAALLPFKLARREWDRLPGGYLCWLKLNFRLNYDYLFHGQPYVYWFREEEVRLLLSGAGLRLSSLMASEALKDPGGSPLPRSCIFYAVAEKPPCRRDAYPSA